jgi:2-keto-4-pentenoate hydratase
MQRLYSAVRYVHPGFEVTDVRFTVNRHLAADQDVDQLDANLALAVLQAGPAVTSPDQLRR